MQAVFISAFILLDLILVGLSLTFWLRDPADEHAWIGVLLLSLPILIFFGWHLLRQSTARTSVHLPWVTVPALLGLAWAGLSLPVSDTPGLLLAAVALASLGLLAYLYWYSNIVLSGNSILQVGALLPDLEFHRLDGSTVRLDRARPGRVLLVFYRGNWCPFCVAQVKEYAAAWQAFSELGIRILFISPQPERKSQRLANRFQASIEFVADRQSAMASRLGIRHTSATPLGLQLFGHPTDSVIPTLVLADKSGRICFVDKTSHYRIRTQPQDLLQHPAFASQDNGVD